MEQTSTRRFIIDQSLKYGLMVGLLSIALRMLTYIINPMSLVSIAMGIFLFIVFIAVIIFSGFAIRKKLGGFIPYKDAILALFLVLLGSMILKEVFDFLLFNFIDPDLGPNLKETMINNTSEMMEKYGAQQEQIDKQIADMDAIRFGDLGAVSLLGNTIGSIIIAAILAVFVKKDAPLFANDHE